MQDRVAVAGEVLQFRIRVAVDYGEHEEWVKSELAPELRNSINAQLSEFLGEEFYVASIEVRPGSIEILAAIATGYTVLAQYKSFFESVERLRKQIRFVVGQRFEGVEGAASVSVSWQPTGTLRNGPVYFSSANVVGVSVPRSVMAYLLVTHGLLTATTILLSLSMTVPL